MKRMVIILLILLLIFIKPNFIWAEEKDTIIVLVDKLSFDLIKDLSLEKYAIGLVNCKTRTQNSKENLLLSLNTGRKLSQDEFKENSWKIDYLGDVFSNEKTSYIGVDNDKLLISNRMGEVDYEIDDINYDYDWLVKNTDFLLEKSSLLLLSYDFNRDYRRVDLLKRYIMHYSDKTFMILPKEASKDDRVLFNKFFIPVIYVNSVDTGILTSKSTKREGFIAIEDISAQIKSIYGKDSKSNVGKPFEIIEEGSPLAKVKDIYTQSANLLIITTFFHGLIYFTQFLFGIKYLRGKKIDEWLLQLYCTSLVTIPLSLVLGISQLNRNVPLYIILCLLLSYGIAKILRETILDFIKTISFTTYSLIVLGMLVYPKAIYNSFIGFNNLFYGARYYGLNNGIMGVLLVSSILTYFSFTKDLNDEWIKRILGLFIFALNMLVLSARFGANTGGFITSVVLFALMLSSIFSFSINKKNIKRIVVLLVLGVGIFAFNMLLDYNNDSKSHAIEFLYRIVNNGFWEFITMASFKAKELLRLIIIPPFSIILIIQILILRRMKSLIKDNPYFKKEFNIVLITSIVGMLINDTGSIAFIFMMFFYILHLIFNVENMENISLR